MVNELSGYEFIVIDGRLSRNYLKGKIGDMQNVIVYASGHNLKWKFN
jgi:hypothetical protein